MEALSDEAKSLRTLTRSIEEKCPCSAYSVNCLWNVWTSILAETEQNGSCAHLNLVRRREVYANRDGDGEHTKDVCGTENAHRFTYLVGAGVAGW